jgi:hypothetical protein
MSAHRKLLHAGLATLATAMMSSAPVAGTYNFVNFDGAGNHTGGTTANGINNNGAIIG